MASNAQRTADDAIENDVRCPPVRVHRNATSQGGAATTDPAARADPGKIIVVPWKRLVFPRKAGVFPWEIRSFQLPIGNLTLCYLQERAQWVPSKTTGINARAGYAV